MSTLNIKVKVLTQNFGICKIWTKLDEYSKVLTFINIERRVRATRTFNLICIFVYIDIIIIVLQMEHLNCQN